MKKDSASKAECSGRLFICQLVVIEGHFGDAL